MRQIKSFKILCLFLFLFYLAALPGWAAEQVGGRVEVNVPAQGLTELNLKTEVCLYRGYTGAPVEALLEKPRMRLTALQITYDQRQQLLTAEEAVRLEAEELVATGATMILTPELLRLPAGGEITTLVPERQKLVVNGEFTYRFTDDTFQGAGGFSLQGPEWMLEGTNFVGSLRAGEMTARGELKFGYQDFWGEAETITYYQQEERVILTGSPFICWEEGFLQGAADTVIVFDLTSGEAKVEGPTKTRFYQDRGVHPSGD